MRWDKVTPPLLGVPNRVPGFAPESYFWFIAPLLILKGFLK